MNPTRPLWQRLLPAVLGLLVLLAGATLLPLRAWLFQFLNWIQPLGLWGPVFLAAAYVLACVLLLPGWILTVGAGFLYGLGLGSATVSLGATLGATAAFFLGRTWARKPVAAWIARHPRWLALDAALERADFKLVLLLRPSPLIPFNVLNYALGLTRIRALRYVGASWLGMLPGTLLYVYLGTAARSLADLSVRQSHPTLSQTIFFWSGLLVTLGTAAYITRLATRAFRPEPPSY